MKLIEVVVAIFTALTAAAGLAISWLAWKRGEIADRREETRNRERQARLVSAWVVREVAEGGEGVVIRNGSDAPIVTVGVRLAPAVAEVTPAAAPSLTKVDARQEPGQMYAEIPPGTYYLQRNRRDGGQAWSLPYAVDGEAGALLVTFEDRQVALVPVTEVPAKLRLAFIGFSDTFGTRWWRIGGGQLTQHPPADWREEELRGTTQLKLSPPRSHGRTETTDAAADLARAVVNLVVTPERRIESGVPAFVEAVSTQGSAHSLSTHVTAFGLSGGKGMGLRMLTAASAGDRSRFVYYLEASGSGEIGQFKYGHLRSGTEKRDQVLANLRPQLVEKGSSRTDDWTPAALATALAEVVAEHQRTLSAR